MIRALVVCVVVFIASVAVFAEEDWQPSINAMVVGDKVLELVESNPITSVKNGKANSVWLSPDGQRVLYNIDGDDESWLCLMDSSGNRKTTLMSFQDSPDDLDDQPNGTKEYWTSLLYP